MAFKSVINVWEMTNDNVNHENKDVQAVSVAVNATTLLFKYMINLNRTSI